MENSEYITVKNLCEHYNIETSFFFRLSEMDILTITTIEEENYIHRDLLDQAEKMLRLHKDLSINPEGIDVVLHLLNKVDRLTEELQTLRNRLNLYE